MEDKNNSATSFVLIAIFAGLIYLLAKPGLPYVIRSVGWVAEITRHIPPFGERSEKIITTVADKAKLKKLSSSYERTYTFLNYSGQLVVPVTVVLGLFLVIGAKRRSVRDRYSKQLDYEQLLEIQKAAFPRIRPVVWLSSRMDDKERGPYTWMLSPYEFSCEHKIIDPSNPKISETWDFDAAVVAFQKQFDLVSDARLAGWLTAIFCSMASNESVVRPTLLGDTLLDSLANSMLVTPDFKCMTAMQKFRWNAAKRGFGTWLWSTYKGPVLNTFKVSFKLAAQLDALAARETKMTREIKAAHAWPLTRLKASLTIAQNVLNKNGGGVPPNGMLWVKAVDRRMWYVIHGCGMQVASVECASIHAHYRAEIKEKKGLLEVDMTLAARALYHSLAIEGWRKPNTISEDQLAAYSVVADTGSILSERIEARAEADRMALEREIDRLREEELAELADDPVERVQP